MIQSRSLLDRQCSSQSPCLTISTSRKSYLLWGLVKPVIQRVWDGLNIPPSVLGRWNDTFNKFYSVPSPRRTNQNNGHNPDVANGWTRLGGPFAVCIANLVAYIDQLIAGSYMYTASLGSVVI